MAHFAKLNEYNIVTEVIVVHNNELLDSNGIELEQNGINFLIAWSGGYTRWKQTSYNGNFRKNYAGAGYLYDEARDAFIPPQPFPSWTLNEDTCRWEAPVQPPADSSRYYVWREEQGLWEEVTMPINTK